MRIASSRDLWRALQVVFVTVGTWCVVSAVLTVLLQDLRIFPAVKNTLSRTILPSRVGVPSRVGAPPGAVEQVEVATADGETLEVWRLSAPQANHSLSPEPLSPNSLALTRKRVALIFRGNDGPLHGFFYFQEWFNELGTTSYLFDYRGYGTSSGWPSEEGLERDGEAVLNYIRHREGVDFQDIVLLGYSIGSGPASKLAKKHRTKALILLAPFIDLPAVVAEIPLLRYLKNFLWYTFPVRDSVADLDTTCLAVAHGEFDQIIPVSHGKAVFRAYQGAYGEFLYSESGDHINIFDKVRSQLTTFLKQCEKGANKPTLNLADDSNN